MRILLQNACIEGKHIMLQIMPAYWMEAYPRAPLISKLSSYGIDGLLLK